MVTLDAIQLKIAKLQKQAETIVEKQASVGLARIRELMAKHGLNLADIERFVGKKRGRKPGASAKTATKRAVAAKYADPKTGATWTGRGRAPLWIRDVKDRSKFLIDGSAANSTANGAAKPAKKTTRRFGHVGGGEKDRNEARGNGQTRQGRTGEKGRSR